MAPPTGGGGPLRGPITAFAIAPWARDEWTPQTTRGKGRGPLRGRRGRDPPGGVAYWGLCCRCQVGELLTVGTRRLRPAFKGQGRHRDGSRRCLARRARRARCGGAGPLAACSGLVVWPCWQRGPMRPFIAFPRPRVLPSVVGWWSGHALDGPVGGGYPAGPSHCWRSVPAAGAVWRVCAAAAAPPDGLPRSGSGPPKSTG